MSRDSRRYSAIFYREKGGSGRDLLHRNPMKEILNISGLCKDYGKGEAKVHALQDVNLTVEEESFIAVAGRSGSGKTTLMNVIGGLEPPGRGEVRIQGTDLYGMKDDERTRFRRRHIGYVFQFFNLLPELTAFENICLPAYLDHRQPEEEFIQDILHRLGLEPKKDRFPAELSGGEQQRVAVARALSHRPDILLADEPTGNLDKRSSGELMELLNFSHRFFHQTILLVTHDLEIARTAQRIITLEDGRIVSDTGGQGR